MQKIEEKTINNDYDLLIGELSKRVQELEGVINEIEDTITSIYQNGNIEDLKVL
jgi:hypothetical protein